MPNSLYSHRNVQSFTDTCLDCGENTNFSRSCKKREPKVHPTLESIREFFKVLRDKARFLEQDAAHGGRTDDGGASQLREQVSMYEAGMEFRIPDAWMNDWNEFTIQQDPEYQDYLRLKGKFEVK